MIMSGSLRLTLMVVTVSVFVRQAHACGRGSISIQDNGYRNILISIADDVPEDERIKPRIKEMFTSASAFLYRATRGRAFFEEIKILVPFSWAMMDEYEEAGRETHDKSDIAVEPPDQRFEHGDRPFVVRALPCGHFGHFMYITPNYILDRNVVEEFGSYEKVLVHEWAHLRYGVFDEYPSEINGTHFYADENGDWEATRCSKSLTGTMYNMETGKDGCDVLDNELQPGCRFRDDVDLEGNYSSIMYRQHLEHIVEFCDNSSYDEKLQHNPASPTAQNVMCEGQSVWEILRAHEDFDGVNLMRDIEDTTPTFRFYRTMVDYTRAVLVLDISGSMEGQRIARLGQSCSIYISNIVKDGDKVGIVTFSTDAKTEIGLTVIDNVTRDELLGYIPTSVMGMTSIGAGIREGIKVLKEDSDGTVGGTLIVVSDGEENRAPYIDDVFNETLAAGLTLQAIAFTDEADSKLDNLAKATGGSSFLYPDSDTSNALNEAFRAIGELGSRGSDEKQILRSEVYELTAAKTSVEDTIYIDETVGRDTEFAFDYSGSGLDIEITSPLGILLDTSSDYAQHDADFRVYTFRIPGLAEVGTWSYRVISNQAQTQRVSLTVASKAQMTGYVPTMAHAYWGQRHLRDITLDSDKQTLHASVSQGYAAVLGADVLATVEGPDGRTSDVKLLDNGAGADITKDDGVYSAYFFDFNSGGRYGVKVSVHGNDNTVVSGHRVVGQSAAASSYAKDALSDVSTGTFDRMASGGSFELENFSPPPGGKLYPPARIGDLKVSAVSYDDQTVTLQWTAVGNELDRGRASLYELRIAETIEDILYDFANQKLVTDDMVISGGGLSSPHSAHEMEVFVIAVPSRGNIGYAFGVVARDTDGRDVAGPLSNIVSASLSYFEPPSDENGGTGPSAGLIAGVTVGSVAAVGAIFVATGMILKTKKKSQVSSQESI